MNLASAPQVRRILAAHGLRPKKRLGQNFLIDGNTLNRIVAASGAAPGIDVLEIGAGLGVVTKALTDTGARVVAIEADRELAPILRETLADSANAEVVVEDFLKLDLESFLSMRWQGKWTVVGNLPYYITSPILTKLIETRGVVGPMLLMVQREVAQRLQAEPGSADYGALTVFVQYHCAVESVMRVSRNVFFPVPEVDSEVIRVTPREQPTVAVKDEATFFSIVRSAFGQRRKTLHNALASSPTVNWGRDRTRAVLDAAGVDGERRGETLSIEEFARLANAA